MAVDTTLRYALNLISCAQVVARKRKSDRVEQQGTLVFEEIGAEEEESKAKDAMVVG